MEKLIIDPEFRDKIPPLTEDEFTQLEENILTDGAVFSPLIVWDNTLLDGHNRYEIIQQHPELTFAVQRLSFANRYEAISWICKHQLGRRNLTPQQKKYLIGQRYEAEKIVDSFRGNQHSPEEDSGAVQVEPHQNDRHVTRSRIARETDTSDSYVMRAGWYAQGVDAAEEVLPGIKQDILTGVIKTSDTAVSAVAKAEPEKRPELVASLRKSKSTWGGKREKSPSEIKYHTPKVSTRKAEMAKIAAISAEMERPKPPVTEADILRSLDREIDSLIQLFEHFYVEFPALLSNSNNKRELIRIMTRFNTYTQKIEGGNQSE